MSDKKINRLIAGYILGSLDEEEKLILKEWIESSETNSNRFNYLLDRKNLAKRYRQWASVDTGKAYRKFQLRTISKKKLAAYIGSIAAGILLLICTTILIAQYFSYQRTEKRMLTAQKEVIHKSQLAGRLEATLTIGESKIALSDNEVYKNVTKILTNNEMQMQTPQTGEFWITLADGTMIHLNADTKLRYPSQFTGPERRVYLEGEAFFKVEHNEKQPFVVVTPYCEVRDYGTSFNVNTKNDSTTKVVLVEGSASLKTDRIEKMIMPGQEAVTSNGNADVIVKNVNPEPIVAWNDGKLALNNYSLRELAEVLSKWYDVEIILASPELGNMKFDGLIDKYGPLDNTLKAIRKLTGFEVKKNGNKIIISNKRE